MKTYGWIVVKVLERTISIISFKVEESEHGQGVPKFPNLIRNGFSIHAKKKVWSAKISRGTRFLLDFISTNNPIEFYQGGEFVLLICQQADDSVSILKAGTKEDFCKALGRPYSPVKDDVTYQVSIPAIKGTVTDPLPKIIERLRSQFPGDPLVYLSDDRNSWYVKAPDGEFKETTMPKLPGKVG